MADFAQLLARQLIPWSNNASQRVIVGKMRMRASILPLGVSMEKLPLRGDRKTIKGGRLYRNMRVLTASWPELGLNESNTFKLACIVAGYTKFHMGNQTVSCGPGYFICIPPGLPHPDGSRNIADQDKSTFCEVIYFRLGINALQCWHSRYEPRLVAPYVRHNILIMHDHAIHLFRILMEELASNAQGKALAEALLPSFFRLIAREIEAGHFQDIPHSAEPRRHQFQDGDFAGQLQQYIQSHLYERPTLEGAARYMYLSRAQFARRVRAEMGKTFIEILNEYRMEVAQDLLRNADWTVSSIATFIGYRTPHHFQMMFRKRMGMTPNDYRKQSRKE